MWWKAILIGLVIVAGVMAGFYFYGRFFFIEGTKPFEINFAAGAGIGLLVGLVGPFVAGARGYDRPRAAALIVVPGLLVLAAVASHFGLVFRNLNPSMDKVFGALMLWAYAFVLIGGLLQWQR
jgi:hypothetical protein